MNTLLIEDIADENAGESEKSEPRRIAPPSPRKQDASKRKSVRSRQGVRRIRRQNNLANLLALVDSDDMGEDGEIAEDLLIEPSTSPISELHEDADKMQTWNNFIESSEAEQLSFLKQIELENECGEFHSVIYHSRTAFVDFQYEANSRYNNIDRNIRSLLKKRKLPMGMLAHIESELADFFTTDPDGIVVYRIHSSYERMLTHALSQYLMLKSRSYNDIGGTRHTSVENQNQHFRNADISLVNYLQRAC